MTSFTAHVNDSGCGFDLIEQAANLYPQNYTFILFKHFISLNFPCKMKLTADFTRLNIMH